MNNRGVLMRSFCLVPMFVCGMEMESRQQQKGWEENCKDACTPGW